MHDRVLLAEPARVRSLYMNNIKHRLALAVPRRWNFYNVAGDGAYALQTAETSKASNVVVGHPEAVSTLTNCL